MFEAVLWPAVPPHAEEFLDRARAGQLVLPHCTNCGWVEPPGADVCSNCLSEDLQWRRASGLGRVYSYVVFQRTFHPAFQAPYAVCVVELEEGPRLVGGVDCTTTQLAIGLCVSATFEGCDSVPRIVFAEVAPSCDASQTKAEALSCK